MFTNFFGGSFFGGGFFGPAVPEGGRPRRERILARVNGKELLFRSWAELEEFIATLKEEAIEKVAEKVESRPVTVIAPGKVIPRIKISAEPEVVALVERANDDIRDAYLSALAEMHRRDDDDASMLLH